MKYRTYGNMVKATKMIMEKGYDRETANKIAIQCFDNAAAAKNGMSIEWWIKQIATKEDFEHDKTVSRQLFKGKV